MRLGALDHLTWKDPIKLMGLCIWINNMTRVMAYANNGPALQLKKIGKETAGRGREMAIWGREMARILALATDWPGCYVRPLADIRQGKYTLVLQKKSTYCQKSSLACQFTRNSHTNTTEYSLLPLKYLPNTAINCVNIYLSLTKVWLYLNVAKSRV